MKFGVLGLGRIGVLFEPLVNQGRNGYAPVVFGMGRSLDVLTAMVQTNPFFAQSKTLRTQP